MYMSEFQQAKKVLQSAQKYHTNNREISRLMGELNEWDFCLITSQVFITHIHDMDSPCSPSQKYEKIRNGG